MSAILEKINDKLSGSKWALGMERLMLNLAERRERLSWKINIKIGGVKLGLEMEIINLKLGGKKWALGLERLMLNLALKCVG